MTDRRIANILLVFLWAAVPACIDAAGLVRANPLADAEGPNEQVLDLPLDGGGQQRLLYAPSPRPVGSIVMLPGGAGDLGLDEAGDIRHGKNFVVRTRPLWVEAGYSVIIPDVAAGASLRGARSSPGYAAIVAQLIRFARSRSPGPVFLLGTSQGAIAAVSGAAHAVPGTLSGVVLTESVSRMGGSHETVFDADPGAVRVPVLVVANRDDRCRVAPPEDAARIAAAMTGSPDATVDMVSGGETGSRNPCGSLTPHGYDGIETLVVGRILGWLNAHR